MRWTLAVLAGLTVLVTGVGAGLYWRVHRVPQDLSASEARRTAPKPTLYCEFYNFMHNATVASFYFAVDPGAGEHPKYSELYVVENEGQKTEFGGPEQPPVPQWSYAIEEATPTIASPDGATRIVLYGLKPHVGGVFWVEAGVRSIAYRNLEGKCRQAHYAASAAEAKH